MGIDVTKDRNTFIGGSDAGVIMGVNKYKSKHELYLEKAGFKEPEQISNDAIDFGNKMEPILRSMFKVINKDKYAVAKMNRRLVHKEHSFIAAHIDGVLMEVETSRYGVLEIKTTTIQNKTMFNDWKDQVPDSYYCQVLHYLAVTGFDFLELMVLMNMPWADKQEIRTYHFERDERLEDIDYLIGKEIEFWQMVKERKEPPMVQQRLDL